MLILFVSQLCSPWHIGAPHVSWFYENIKASTLGLGLGLWKMIQIERPKPEQVFSGQPTWIWNDRCFCRERQGFSSDSLLYGIGDGSQVMNKPTGEGKPFRPASFPGLETFSLFFQSKVLKASKGHKWRQYFESTIHITVTPPSSDVSWQLLKNQAFRA